VKMDKNFTSFSFSTFLFYFRRAGFVLPHYIIPYDFKKNQALSVTNQALSPESRRLSAETRCLFSKKQALFNG